MFKQIKHFSNIYLFLFEISELFYFNITGNDINELQLENILLIYLTLLVSHFDIAGNDINELQFENILLIFSISEVFHFDISGNNINELYSENIFCI